MRRVVAFDGSILGTGPITGVAGSFLATLRAYASRATDFECVLLAPSPSSSPSSRTDATPISIPGVRTVPCIPVGPRWRRRRALVRACRELDARLLHSPVTSIPARAPCPTIATVHDLPWLYPELRHEDGARLAPRIALRMAIRTATALIVPSAATLADLRRFSAIDEKRVVVIHHGVELPEQPANETALTGPFLVLGDARPRKNLPRIRAAHARAREQCPGLPELRLVGPGHGFVTEDEKWHILRQSRALVHLSLLEGFGLPVLEALAHGVPAVCSNQTSLPEVAGDAALFVDPRDEAAIAHALGRIHLDHALRSQLRERGLRRAQELTTAATATAWVRLHREIVTGAD